jgi:ABC-type ATPase with predicted acetyltransferase domain
LPRENLSEIYAKYREQIDTIASLPKMRYRRLARIVAWFYGGTEESWRKILATRSRRKKMPGDVHQILESFGKRKSKA